MSKVILLMGFFLLGASSAALAENWNFPLELDDQNTTIEFTVDSTWHLLHGKTSDVHGRIWLADSADPSSVRGTISVPVKRFNTDGERRDRRLREVLAETEYPEVTYTISSAETHCSPAALSEATPCPVILHGRIAIHGQEREWTLLGGLSKKEGTFRLDAQSSLLWSDFGIEDPSILVARLAKEVNVSVQVQWRQ